MQGNCPSCHKSASEVELTCGAEADRVHRVAIRGLQPSEAAHVRLHAVEVKHAQAVVSTPSQQTRPAVIHIQRCHNLTLACARRTDQMLHCRCGVTVSYHMI